MQAKKCDITGEFYEETERRFKILDSKGITESKPIGTVVDISPKIYAKLETLLQVVEKKEKLKKRKKYNFTTEFKEEKSRVLSYAKEIQRKSNKKIKWGDCLRKAYKDLRTHQKMPMKIIEISLKPKCPMCKEVEVRKKGEMCDECSRLFDRRNK